jgi:hypothetical protein
VPVIRMSLFDFRGTDRNCHSCGMQIVFRRFIVTNIFQALNCKFRLEIINRITHSVKTALTAKSQAKNWMSLFDSTQDLQPSVLKMETVCSPKRWYLATSPQKTNIDIIMRCLVRARAHLVGR